MSNERLRLLPSHDKKYANDINGGCLQVLDLFYKVDFDCLRVGCSLEEILPILIKAVLWNRL